jgi:hypothetical protein
VEITNFLTVADFPYSYCPRQGKKVASQKQGCRLSPDIVDFDECDSGHLSRLPKNRSKGASQLGNTSFLLSVLLDAI